MSMVAPAAILADPPQQFQRAQGEGRISTRWRDGRTHLATLYQAGCAKIRLPNTHSPTLEAALINTAGGLTGGDDLRWHATAAPETRLVLTTPACERIYRSLGEDAKVVIRLSVGRGAHLDWLPQETILFDGSRLNRRLDVDLAEDASLTLAETVLLGRQAMGETARTAQLRDNWRIQRQGRLVHAEATQLRKDGADRDSLSLLDGASAFGTILFIGDNAERKLQKVRRLIPAAARAGASLVDDRLIVRAVAASALMLRRIIVPILAELSQGGALPRH